MNCQTMLKITREVLGENGTIPVLSSHFLPHTDNGYSQQKISEMNEIIKSADKSIVAKIDHETFKTVFDEYGLFKKDFIKNLLLKKENELTDFLLEIGNPTDMLNQPLSHYLITHQSYRFGMESLMRLSEYRDSLGRTASHIMMNAKIKFFNPKEIMDLGNPVDNRGNTLAHYRLSAQHDFYFSFQDIVSFNNPANDDGETLAHVSAEHGLTLEPHQIAALGNPETEIGLTIDNMMYEYEHRYHLGL